MQSMLQLFERTLMARGRAPNTIKAYTGWVERFEGFVGRPLDEVAIEDLEAGGRVDVQGGGEALPDTEPPDCLREDPPPELAAEIGDEVLRGAEDPGGGGQEVRTILAASGFASPTCSARGTREKASKTPATWKTWRPRNERTSVTSIIQTWWTKRVITGCGALVGLHGEGDSRGVLAVILRTERAETVQPAPARVRAIKSSPPTPLRAMRSIVARTASAKRRTGGTGFTVQPTVLARGSAQRSQFEMVFEQTRKTWAARSRDQPRRLLTSRARKRCEGE